MTKKELTKRYFIFAVGLIIVALGVAIAAKSELGPSPISSIPYSLWLIMPKLSMGEWTIIFNVMLVGMQALIQKIEAKPVQLILQVVTTLPFGYVIDFWLWCMKNMAPDTYMMQFILVLAGCFVVAFGVFIQVKADVILLPGDAFIRAAAGALKKEFGKVRTASDITMTAISFALCLIFIGGLNGIREGTVIAALLVGNIVRMYGRVLVKCRDE